jgi:hypothetical protein
MTKAINAEKGSSTLRSYCTVHTLRALSTTHIRFPSSARHRSIASVVAVVWLGQNKSCTNVNGISYPAVYC